MKRFIIYLFILPLLHLATNITAQDQNLLKSFLTVEDGLSHNEVTSIVQDHDGFIWIGTRGGLNRYDGYEFKVFNQVPGDSNSLVNPSIESLFVDSKGNIWIGTKSGGISKYNPVTGIFKNFASNYKTSNRLLSDNRILAFSEDDDGRIWMGTWESGLIVYDDVKGISQEFFSNNRINSIVKTSEGKMWVGTDYGLEEFDASDNTFKHYPIGYCQEIVYDDKRNVVWVVHGSSAGFRKFDLRNGQWEKLQMPTSVSNLKFGIQPYESVLIDKKDRCWLGTWGRGLYTFLPDSESFNRYLIYPEYRGTMNKDYDAVLDIFEDRDGNIWLGTNGGGVCVLKEKLNFNSVGYHPETNKGLKNTRIMSIVDDKNGNLWLGTIGSGLVWSPDKENFYTVEYPKFVDESRFFTIKNLYEDNSGRIWAGASVQTFEIIFRNSQPQMISAVERYGIRQDQGAIVSFLDAFDMFWMGSLQRGLFLYDKKNNFNFIKRIHQGGTNSNNQKSDRISYLFKDSRGRIWAGTYNGLHVYNPADTSLVIAEDYFHIEGEFTGNIITCVDEDTKGNIWIGTPNGLNKLSEIDEDNFKVSFFTELNGLASNFVKGISHDLNGNIWLSTNVGISKLNTKENNRFVNFDETDGVLGKNFTEASAFRNTRGEIFFGGTHGITWFHPDKIVEHEYLTQPVFTGLKVLNKNVEAGVHKDKNSILTKSITHVGKIELSYRQNNFEIEFSALDFKAMGKNKYNYKLETHDIDWHDIGTRHFVNFNNLRPGEYKLLVKSSNRHGFWNEQPAELTIRINPPFWQTWYALIFYILLVVGLVTIIRWNAIKQVRLANNLEMEKLQHEQDQRINEMKLRFFTNLSHEFRTPLTLILAPLKELLGKKDQFKLNKEAQNKIGIVQNNSHRLMKLVNQLLDFRKVESGNVRLRTSRTDISDFVAEVCYPFHELAKINNISFNTSLELKTKHLWIDKDKLEVIINNLLSNAFKHAVDHGKIEVALYEEEDEILLTVSDNGPGIPKTELSNIFDRFYRIGSNNDYGSSGIGLALVKRYVELHHGSISVVSKPNEHTEFTVSLLKGADHLKPEEMVRKEKHEKYLLRTEQLIGNVLPGLTPKQNKKSAECVLVVEDNREVNNYLSGILKENYCVYIAENGEEGFSIAVEKLPDIIISDVMMPKVDGFEFCKKIKTNESTSTIPFIFLTAKSDEQFKLLGTQLGADDFISKPFDPNLLLEKVKNILESRKKLQKQYSKSIRLEPSDIEITSSEEIFIEKAISVIESNLENHKFTSEVLASEMNMSSSSLYRRLKGLTGSSTAEFIRSIRIKRAAQLLVDRELTITEIAYSVGFNDVKHFRTVFQKHFTCSPSEYREKL